MKGISTRSITATIAFLITFVLSQFIVSPPIFGQNDQEGAVQLYRQGISLQEKGNQAEAVDCFKRAVKAKKDYADAFFAMGVSYYKMKRTKKAIRTFREVLQINPRSSETHNNLAVIYAEEGDYDRAIRELKETVRLDPDYDQGHLNLADLYLSLSIREYFKTLRMKGPDHPDLRKKLRILLTSDPDKPEFQVDLEKLNHLEGRVDTTVKRTEALRPRTSPSDNRKENLEFLILVNNKPKKVPNGGTIAISPEDTLIIQGISPIATDRKDVKINFVGFVGNKRYNDADDRGYPIRPADLWKRRSTNRQGGLYRIEANRHDKLLGQIQVRIVPGEETP
jgi:tetratricopeptide (TPR) repeat protein